MAARRNLPRFVRGRIRAARGFPEIHIGPSSPTSSGKSQRETRLALEQYSAVINVSDSPCHAFTLRRPLQVWAPIMESGHWGYAPFFVALRLLEHLRACGRKRPIYVHCHAGAHRSWIVTYVVLRALGHKRGLQAFSRLDRTLFRRDMEEGRIPAPIFRLLEVAIAHPTWSLEGCARELLVKGPLKNRWKKMRRAAMDRYHRSSALA